MGNYHFIWLLPDKVTMEASLHKNQKIIDKIKAEVPTYDNRACTVMYVVDTQTV